MNEKITYTNGIVIFFDFIVLLYRISLLYYIFLFCMQF